MSTINMRKVDGAFEAEDFNPYSEYVHPSAEPQTEDVAAGIQRATHMMLRPKEELLNNIDAMFDGADFVFEIANKFLKRFGG